MDYFTSLYEAPFGILALDFVNGELQGVTISEHERDHFSGFDLRRTPRRIARLFDDFFDGKDVDFGFEYCIASTPLQNKIYRIITQIPRGKAATYGHVARLAGTHPRIVGNACRRNMMPFVVPCHRVVHGDGAVGLYIGKPYASALKFWLLQMEGSAPEGVDPWPEPWNAKLPASSVLR